MKNLRMIMALLLGMIVSLEGLPGQDRMTLDEAIATSRRQSVQALEAKHAFVSTYWAYRSYLASRLPSINLYGNLMNYDRSLTLLQSYDDGSFKYADTYNLQNSLGLQLAQNITLTGGRLYLYSDLSRIDQFGVNNKLTWYTQPVTMSYVQPLFAYNQFRWDKMIEPKEYERGKRKYIEAMEDITIQVAQSYFALIGASRNYESSRVNCENTEAMRSIALERMKIGSVTKDEYLQLELRAINDSLNVGENLVALREAQMKLNSLLGFDESVEVIPVVEDALPDVFMDYDLVLDKCLRNSTFSLDNEINELEAASAVAKAKADRGISMSLNARLGLSQTGSTMPDAYKDLLNQEVVGLSFSIPIFDWGLGRGKVQKAKAAQEVIRAQTLQSENDNRRKLFVAVGQFNTQRQQCIASHKAMDIAAERYSLMMEKFRAGTATVTQLTDAQNDSDEARTKYLSDLGNYWNYYYTLRYYTLYDFIKGEDIDIDVTEMID
ncbi:MAG: TolC family protein [Bacteroidales bacterium]|nr:TolC family protein [Candidatus Cryptobacteroides faecihippi]MCQ2162888.1 TolC family protein [Bacteroidales bacterium]